MPYNATALKPNRDKAVALIIVLAFVVLLTGLAVAFLSRGTNNRQVAQSSFHDTDATLLARSALDIVVGDFKQELIKGSTLSFGRYAPVTDGTVVNGSLVYAAILPQRDGTDDLLPNLIRRSFYSALTPPAPAVLSRASNVNSATASYNQRFISRDRWNSHYLLPRLDLTAAAGVTRPRAEFTAPDWVIVTRAGPTPFPGWDSTLNDPTATNNNYAVGRYAYAVYDEGGLLDVNVAGYPLPASLPPAWVTDVGRKGVLAFADLRALPATTENPPNPMTSAAINKLILFRNTATTTNTTSLGTTTSYIALQANNFSNYYLGLNTGPAGVAGVSLTARFGTSQDFGAVNQASIGSGLSTRTDQNFVTRAELIAFFNSGSSLPQNINALQYLGTFSREKNIATWRANGNGPTTNNIENALNAGRFYMANLDWVRPLAGPGQPPGNVWQNLGLKWNKGTTPDPGYWSYHGGPTNPNALDHIPALTGNTRQFVGLLNYALNKQGGDDYSNIGQTLAICADLIDQYDDSNATESVSGSTTTVISYNLQGVTTGEGKAYIYGMENVDSKRPAWAPTSGFTQLDRPFRNAGDFGYVLRQASIRPDNTLDFYSAGSLDAAVLDLFTYNSAPVRSGTVSLNTRQAPVLAAILKGALTTDGAASSTVTLGPATNAANAIMSETMKIDPAHGLVPQDPLSPDPTNGPAWSRRDLVRLASLVNTTPFGSGVSDEVRETIPRALSECVQTRTWGLLIDLVAQTGHYAPSAQGLADFIVEGEKRYWLHIAIDRFDGSIIDQRLEEVIE